MGALDLVTWWPVDKAAAGVLRRTPPAALHDSAGVSAAASVGDPERPFAWASMTKLLVTMAVLVAVEEGTISLDDPAGPPGATVGHLLSHASGLGPDSPVPVSAPARMRIYSNIGFEILAETLAQRARMPFVDYLAGGVLTPLGLSSTSLPSESSPASGAHGPLRDLLALAAELLVPTLVSAATLKKATAVAFPGLRGVLPGYGRFDPCDWGLGFEVKGTKSPHWTGDRTTPATFGHFGRAGGFLWVDPVAGLACAVLSNRDFGPWAVTEWPTLADAVVDEWASTPVATTPLTAVPLSTGAITTSPVAGSMAHEPVQVHAAQVHAAQVQAAEAERRKREALEAERRSRAAAAAAEEVETRRRQKEAAEAQRSRQKAARVEEARTDGGRTDAALTPLSDRESAGTQYRVAAMTERRDTAVARVPDGEPVGERPEEEGSLGPGIRPVDFWGASPS